MNDRKSEHELCEIEQHTAGVVNRMRIDYNASKAYIFNARKIFLQWDKNQ